MSFFTRTRRMLINLSALPLWWKTCDPKLIYGYQNNNDYIAVTRRLPDDGGPYDGRSFVSLYKGITVTVQLIDALHPVG